MQEFAGITSHLNIMYCYSLIHDNVNITNITSLKSPQAVSNIVKRLESFFPFDPLSLLRAVRDITPIYRVWDGVVEDNEEGDSEDDDEGCISMDESLACSSLESFRAMSLEC